jgi:hypothetical protein
LNAASLDPTRSRFHHNSTLSSQQAGDWVSIAHSLIALDMSLPDYIPEISRPSTASSDERSPTSEPKTPGNPFELERHISLYQPVPGDQNLAKVATSDTESGVIYSFPNDAVKTQDSGVSDSECISKPPSQGASR